MTITDRIMDTLDRQYRVVGIFNLAYRIIGASSTYWVRQCLRRLEAEKKIELVGHGSGRPTEIFRRRQR